MEDALSLSRVANEDAIDFMLAEILQTNALTDLEALECDLKAEMWYQLAEGELPFNHWTVEGIAGCDTYIEDDVPETPEGCEEKAEEKAEKIEDIRRKAAD